MITVQHAYTLELGELGTVIGYWDPAFGCFETDWISAPRTIQQEKPQPHTLEQAA